MSNRISSCFFKTLEDEIKSMWGNIRCIDVYNLYFDFWKTLKEETGSADGFTGLSEIIVFIILKELIEKEYGELKRREYSNDTNYFYNPKFAIGRGLTINIGKGKRRKPDIVIWRDPGENLRKIPDGAIEVKIYASEGIRTVRDTIDRLKALKNASRSNSFKGMIIFYTSPPEEGKKLLKRLKKDGWLDYLILTEDKNEDFVNRLRKHLNI